MTGAPPPTDLVLGRGERGQAGRISAEPIHAAAQRQFTSSLSAPSQARTFVMETLLSWGRRTALPEVEVVASELLTNAVLYAGGDIEMRLDLCEECLRVEVTDAAHDRLPVLRPDPPRPGGGYGLHIVDAIAQSWGCDPVDGHKTVWAEINLTHFGP